MSLMPRFTVTHAITAALTRIERARGFLEAAKLSEDWIRRMVERALVLEAHHTTHIEGTQLTLEQSERLLAGQAVPEANPDDVRELLNYRRALEFVSTYLGEGGPITEFIRFSTATVAPRGCFRPSVFTGQATTSSGSSPSAGTTTAIGPPSTGQSRACGSGTWTSPGGSSTSWRV